MPGPQRQPKRTFLKEPEKAAMENPSRMERALTEMRKEIHPNLMLLKLLMFFIFGGISALYPFLIPHLSSLGLTFTDIGMMIPFAIIFGPICGGMLADKLGSSKPVMIILLLMSVVSHLALWFAVPSLFPRTVDVPYPIHTFDLHINCSEDIQTHDNYFYLPQLPNNCSSADHYVANANLTSRQTSCRVCLPTYPKLCQSDNLCYDETNKIIALSNVTMQKSAVGEMWQLLRFEDDVETLGLHCHNSWKEAAELPVSCADFGSEMEQCELVYRAYTDFTVSCSHQEEPKFSKLEVKVIYVFIRTFGSIAVFSLISLLDSTAYALARDHTSDLGRQRMFSVFGMAITPPIAGAIISAFSSPSRPVTDFSPAFYLCAGFHLLAAVVCSMIVFKPQKPAMNIRSSLANILRDPKVVVFIIMMFAAGALWGFLDYYLIMYMMKLKSPVWLAGLTPTIAGIAAIPIVAKSTRIIGWLGHTKILMICFFLYALRGLAYAYLTDPYLFLPVEMMRAFTTSLLWVVACIFCAKLAPDYLGTLQGVVSAAHYCLGQGLGSALGGIMFEMYVNIPVPDGKDMYLLFASAAAITGSIYAILHFAWLRNLGESGECEDDFDDVDLEAADLENKEGVVEKPLPSPTGRDAFRLTPLLEQDANGTTPDIKESRRSKRRLRSAGSVTFELAPANSEALDLDEADDVADLQTPTRREGVKLPSLPEEEVQNTAPEVKELRQSIKRRSIKFQPSRRSLKSGLSVKDQQDVVDMAKFQGLTYTFSSRSIGS